jgi:hypothetical protein
VEGEQQGAVKIMIDIFHKVQINDLPAVDFGDGVAVFSAVKPPKHIFSLLF